MVSLGIFFVHSGSMVLYLIRVFYCRLVEENGQVSSHYETPQGFTQTPQGSP
jgi:hypothetical protein